MKVIEQNTRIEEGLKFRDVAFAGIIVLISSLVICIFLGIFLYCFRRKQATDLEKSSIAPKPLDWSPEHEKRIINEAASAMSDTRVGSMGGHM
jgi:hypothetical protein